MNHQQPQQYVQQQMGQPQQMMQQQMPQNQGQVEFG